MTDTHATKDFDLLLDYLKHSRGFDFSGYKRPSLMRRIHKRMQTVGIGAFTDYIDYLEVHPDEFSELFNTILINVTGFFRDPKAWAYIDEYIIPRILANKKDSDPVRVWSAGCASGEEAYTVAMLMAEHIGVESFKERVKVYATDLDDDALTRARVAVYTVNDLEGLPPEMLEKYFERNGQGFVFNKELRRSVVFGKHDLITDAPISRIDLLVCRNILMYFNAEAQSKILARLNYSLAENGFLFLGKAEMLLTHANLFLPVDLRNRIFVKAPSVNLRDRLLVMAQNGGGDDSAASLFGHVRLRDAAIDAGAIAQVVVDTSGYLTLANERARSLFGLSPRDIGRPFQDLELSYRPVELRTSIESASARNVPVTLKDIEMMVNSVDSIFLNIILVPLSANGSGVVGVSISFVDVTEYKRLQFQLEQTNQELETAMEEVQSTNEELETTNEELQSTIEELETTNEELQSTNEELETMNEELQSTNEELETMNDEMTQRSTELNELNAFLESILRSMRGGVIVVDNDSNVQIWNRKSEDLWGLRAEEVMGHNLFGLDIGLPVDQLKKPVRAICGGETELIELQVPALNRRGRNVLCDVTCTPLQDGKKETRGVILVVEEVGAAEERGEKEEKRKVVD